MPGRFVVDDVDPDYGSRPDPQHTVDDIKALARGGVSDSA